MKTPTSALKIVIIISLFAFTISCNKDESNDPNPSGGGGGGGGSLGGGTGTISTNCSTSLSGSGSFNFNGIGSSGIIIVTGICVTTSSLYAATISDTSGRDIVVYFRGQPNSGTFNIKKQSDFLQTSTPADCYIVVDNLQPSSNYTSRSVSTKITVTRSTNGIRIQLPQVTLDRLGIGGPETITAQADFTIQQ